MAQAYCQIFEEDGLKNLIKFKEKSFLKIIEDMKNQLKPDWKFTGNPSTLVFNYFNPSLEIQLTKEQGRGVFTT